jgi:hypothetical protein
VEEAEEDAGGRVGFEIRVSQARFSSWSLSYVSGSAMERGVSSLLFDLQF